MNRVLTPPWPAVRSIRMHCPNDSNVAPDFIPSRTQTAEHLILHTKPVWLCINRKEPSAVIIPNSLSPPHSPHMCTVKYKAPSDWAESIKSSPLPNRIVETQYCYVSAETWFGHNSAINPCLRILNKVHFIERFGPAAWGACWLVTLWLIMWPVWKRNRDLQRPSPNTMNW